MYDQFGNFKRHYIGMLGLKQLESEQKPSAIPLLHPGISHKYIETLSKLQASNSTMLGWRPYLWLPFLHTPCYASAFPRVCLHIIYLSSICCKDKARTHSRHSRGRSSSGDLLHHRTYSIAEPIGLDLSGSQSRRKVLASVDWTSGRWHLYIRHVHRHS